MNSTKRRPPPSAYHKDALFSRIGALAVLEQKMLASRDLTACIECDDPGTVRQESVLIKSVPFYWMCDGCDTYWRNHG